MKVLCWNNCGKWQANWASLKNFPFPVSFRSANCAIFFMTRTFFCTRAKRVPMEIRKGVPNSMLEAMASGLPAFATAHGGIPEAIEDGVSGVLVSEGDDAALSCALLAAAEQRDVLTKLAERGAATVLEKFEQGAQARKLEDYYFEAMGYRTPRGIPI